MSVWYIKESKEKNSFIKNIKQILNVIQIEERDKKVFCTLPINEKTKDKKIISISKKLNNELYKNCIENVVLSNSLENLEVLKNELYSNNINILDGRILFQYLTLNIIEYIYKIQNKKIEEGQIAILANDSTNLNLDNIIDIAKKVKTVNIVTNNIQKFKKIEEYLYNEFGIMIRVSNNQKRDLLNADIIVNIDFAKQTLKKYKMSAKCILLNINEEYEINTKKFCGININNFEISMPKECEIEGFKNELIYESFICNKSIEEVKKIIKKDHIKISNLLGKSGYINKNEFIELST